MFQALKNSKQIYLSLDRRKIPEYEGIVLIRKGRRLDKCLIEKVLKEYGVCEEGIERAFQLLPLHVGIIVTDRTKIKPQKTHVYYTCKGNFLIYPLYQTCRSDLYAFMLRKILKELYERKEIRESKLEKDLFVSRNRGSGVKVTPRRFRNFLEKFSDEGILKSKSIFVEKDGIKKLKDRKYKLNLNLKFVFC